MRATVLPLTSAYLALTQGNAREYSRNLSWTYVLTAFWQLWEPEIQFTERTKRPQNLYAWESALYIS
jgi:hypothetical protein